MPSPGNVSVRWAPFLFNFSAVLFFGRAVLRRDIYAIPLGGSRLLGCDNGYETRFGCFLLYIGSAWLRSLGASNVNP